MTRSCVLMAIVVVLSASCGQASPPVGQAAAQSLAAPDDGPLRELADSLSGRWRWTITLAADYPGIGQKGDKVVGYEACRWIADRHAIECELAYGSGTETWFFWWDASTKQIKSLNLDSGSEGPIWKQGSEWLWRLTMTLPDARTMRLESVQTLRDNGNTRVVQGATIVEGTRTEFRDVAIRVFK